MSGPGPSAAVTAATRKLVDRMLDRWPNHKKTAAQLREYLVDVQTLVNRFGSDRVEAAYQEARIRRGFLPEPAELFELLPPIAEHAKPKPPGPDPNCRECGGSGWKDAPGPDRRVTRCHCRAPAALTKPAFAPDIKPFHAVLKEAVDRIKTVDPLPDDPKRRAELKERIARTEADKEALRERTKQDAAIREILPSLPTETEIGDKAEWEIVQ
jgi:hypothetical protein